MEINKQRRAQLRTFRKALQLKQGQLAALAGVSPEMVARFERCKHVSRIVEERVTEAIFRMIAKKNPEAVNRAAQPALEAADKWERVLSVKPGSEAALSLEKQTGKSLAELKIQAESVAGLLRGAANAAILLTE